MDATTFDGMSRQLGSVSTRRSMLRLLGGAAAVGTILAAGSDSLARKKLNGNGNGNGNGREQVSAQGKAKGKKITICYQNQTKLVKKSKLGNFPGATKGACPTGGGNGGGGNSGGGGGGQQPIVCSRWIISGGPSQTDKIVADDDLLISNMSQGGSAVLNDMNGSASTLSAVVFDAKVGDQLRIYGYDRGGCRSLSPLWLHCQATGQKRQLFGGYSGVNCSYNVGGFVEEFREVFV